MYILLSQMPEIANQRMTKKDYGSPKDTYSLSRNALIRCMLNLDKHH